MDQKLGKHSPGSAKPGPFSPCIHMLHARAKTRQNRSTQMAAAESRHDAHHLQHLTLTVCKMPSGGDLNMLFSSSSSSWYIEQSTCCTLQPTLHRRFPRSSSREVRLRRVREVGLVRVPFFLSSILVGEPSPEKRVKGHYMGDLVPSRRGSFFPLRVIAQLPTATAEYSFRSAYLGMPKELDVVQSASCA